MFGFYIQNYVCADKFDDFFVFYQSDMFSSVDTTASVNQPAEYQYRMQGMNAISFCSYFLVFFSQNM